MGNSTATAELTKELASRHGILMLGGLAVISHGHSRQTYGADIWLDSKCSYQRWAEAVIDAFSRAPK